MMNWMNLLAARGDSEGDWVRIVLIVVALAIGLIVKLIKAAIERAKQAPRQPTPRRAEESWQQSQRQQADEDEQELPQQEQAEEWEPWQPQEPARHPHPPAQPARRMHAPPPPPLNAQREQTLKEHLAAKGNKVQERVRRTAHTLEQLQAAAQLRSTARTRQLEREPQAAPPVKIVLRTVADARSAILYSEVIAPCKALRQAPEMWD